MSTPVPIVGRRLFNIAILIDYTTSLVGPFINIVAYFKACAPSRSRLCPAACANRRAIGIRWRISETVYLVLVGRARNRGAPGTVGAAHVGLTGARFLFPAGADCAVPRGPCFAGSPGSSSPRNPRPGNR